MNKIKPCYIEQVMFLYYLLFLLKKDPIALNKLVNSINLSLQSQLTNNVIVV